MRTKLEFIRKIFHQHFQILMILGFFILYFFGFSFLGEVGVNYDEKAEQDILRMNILSYVKLVDPDNDLIKSYQKNKIIPIDQSKEKDHGISPYYPFSFLFAFNMDDYTLSYAWHLYTYTFNFLGVIFLFLLIKMLWKSNLIAIMSSLMYFFTPRLFADIFYNNKDCILLSLVVMMMYFGIRMIRYKTYQSALSFGITSAFASNVKISGGFVFAILGLFYLYDLTKNRKWNKKNFLVGLTSLVAFLILYILITPALWTGGFKFIEFFTWSFSNTFRFSRNYGDVWFENHLYEYWSDPLPWYYLPKIIILTIPIFISVLFMIGVFFSFQKMLTKESRQEVVLCLILFFIPFFIVIFSQPNIYNGWRHFYFLYAPFIVLVSYGLFCLISFSKLYKFILCILWLCLLINGIGIFKNGISSTTYYNILAKNPSQNYEMDYYGILATKVLQEIAKDQKEPIYIYGFSNWEITLNYKYLKKEYKDKINLIYHEEHLEQVKSFGIRPYYLYFVSRNRENIKSEDRLIIKDKVKIKEFSAWENYYAALYR